MSNCRACGAALAGPYCQACGQPSTAAARTLRETLTGQSGRIVHTLRTLLLAPGELAREIDEGRDRRSLRPISLLLHLVAIFFLLSVFTGFGPEAVGGADPSGGLARKIAEDAERSHLPRAIFDERLAHRFQTAYTVLLPVIALAYGGALGLTHWRRKPWIIPLAAGIQYLCFVYLWVAMLFALARPFVASVYRNPSLLVIEAAVALVYLTLLCRRVYDEKWGWAAAKSAVVLLSGAIVHNLMIIAALFIALATL